MNAARVAVIAISGVLLSSCGKGTAAMGLSIPHPDDSAKQVEYFLEKPTGEGPWPTIVLLHGHQEGAKPGGKVFVEWGALQQLAARGYLAVAVSQPGYGNSDGPPDFCGTYTQHAVSAVIAQLRKDALAAPQKLVIQGVSRGALTAGLVAAHDPSVSGLILISGVYDLPAYVAGAEASPERSFVVKTMLAESGGTPDALKNRSVLNIADRIDAAVLILNGAGDARTDAAQAQKLAEQITKSGGNAKAIVYPGFGHKIPVAARNKDIDPFIDRVLGSGNAR